MEKKLSLKDKCFLWLLAVGVVIIISGLAYSSCNNPAYAEERIQPQDSTRQDSIATINIPATRKNFVEQLQKLEADKLKIIGILEYLNWLESTQKGK